MFVFETWNLLEYNLNGISWKIVSLLYYIMESERKIFQILFKVIYDLMNFISI